MKKKNNISVVIVLLSSLLVLSTFGFPAASIPASYAASCSPAGNTGLNASVIAVSNHVYRGVMSAVGCDIGIYVGANVTGVTITNATITGANDHAILAQDTTNVTVSFSTITGNGLNPHTCASGQHTNCINEDKAVEFVGVSGSFIVNNNVSHNLADGGIGIADDGAVNAGAPSGGSGHFTSSNDVIANNVIEYNANGCGVVIAGYNNGTATVNIVAKNNTVFGNSIPKNPPHGPPAIGQIVLAADVPGSMLTGTVITNNTIDGSLPPGIVVHANAPGDVITNTTISSNVISNNGDEAPPSPFYTVNSPVTPTGIALIGESFTNSSGQIVSIPNGPKINSTTIINNKVLNDANAVWVCNAGQTSVSGVTGNASVQVRLCSTQTPSEVNATGLTVVGGSTSSTTSTTSTSTTSSSTTTSTTTSETTAVSSSSTTSSASSSSSAVALSTGIAAPIAVSILVMLGALIFTRRRRNSISTSK